MLLYKFLIVIGISTIWYDNLIGQQNDSAIAMDTSEIEVRNGILDVFEGAPGKAAIRGLLIPAGGQIYNKRWWKVPLALAAEGVAIWFVANQYDNYNLWNQEYINVVINGASPTLGITNSDVILSRRNKYRDQREMAWVFFLATHVFIAFEAYLDRHLIDFDVSEDLSIIPEVSPFGVYPAIALTIPLN